MWFNCTVKSPRFTDSCLIRTPHYYGQLASSFGKESPLIFSKSNLANTDTFYGPLTVHGVNGVWLYIFILLINWYSLMQVMLEIFVMENRMAVTEIFILVMATSHAPMRLHIKCLVQQAWCTMWKKINVTTPKTLNVSCSVHVSIKHSCTKLWSIHCISSRIFENVPGFWSLRWE